VERRSSRVTWIHPRIPVVRIPPPDCHSVAPNLVEGSFCEPRPETAYSEVGGAAGSSYAAVGILLAQDLSAQSVADPAALEWRRGSHTASKPMVRLAAVLSIILGLGFGLPCAYGIRYLSRTGEVWTFLGFPTYGGGPFERIGIRTTVPLLVAFLGVCGLEVLMGWLLWRGRRASRVLAVGLLPIELAFWMGFALPFGPPLGLARAILVIRK
jgi:hypothetical protein